MARRAGPVSYTHLVDELLEDQGAGEHVQVVQLRRGRLRIALQLNGWIYLSRIIETGLGEIPHMEILFAHEDMQVFGYVGIALFIDCLLYTSRCV